MYSNADLYEQKHYHSAIAAALHVGEAVQAFFLASLQYNLNPLVVLLWTLNVFFFGIFGFWPLAFPLVKMLMIKDSRLKKDSIWNSDILCTNWCMKNLSGESKFFLQVFQDNKVTYCSLPGSLCFNTDLQWKLNRLMFWQRHMVNLSSWGLMMKIWIPSNWARCESVQPSQVENNLTPTQNTIMSVSVLIFVNFGTPPHYLG